MMLIARLTPLAVALALAVPSTAPAQSGNPVAPLPQPLPDTTTQQQAPAQPTTTNPTDDSGLGTMGDILIYGAGAVLLLGIGLLVVRDARRRAPVEERASQPRGTHSPQRHARARAKAKAARAQRK